MAMDNELRKILLREQDLRFVTDTLTQYLGKKAEDRKYYADQAHLERIEAKKLQAEGEEDAPDLFQWELEAGGVMTGTREEVDTAVLDKTIKAGTTFYKQKTGIPSISGGAQDKLYQWRDTSGNMQTGTLYDAKQAEADKTIKGTYYNISTMPKPVKDTAPVKKQRYIDLGAVDFKVSNMEPSAVKKILLEEYGLNIEGNVGILSPLLDDSQADKITRLLGQGIWKTADDKKVKDDDKVKRGDFVYFIPTKNVNIDGRIYKPGEQALIPADKAYIHQKNGSGDIQLTKTDKKSLDWSEKEEIQFTEYKRMRKHLYDELGLVIDPLVPTTVASVRVSLEETYGKEKTYDEILKTIIFPEAKEYEYYKKLDAKFSHIWVVDDASPASTEKQFQWPNK